MHHYINTLHISIICCITLRVVSRCYDTLLDTNEMVKIVKAIQYEPTTLQTKASQMTIKAESTSFKTVSTKTKQNKTTLYLIFFYCIKLTTTGVPNKTLQLYVHN